MLNRLLTSMAIALLALASTGAQATEKITIGNAQTVVKTVTGTLEADHRNIKLLDDIYHNELVETGEKSATEFVFLDETKLALGPNSSLVLDRFVYDPDPSKSSFVVTATAGVFRFVSGKLPKKAYEIHTPTATIGVRGTDFLIVVIPGDLKRDGRGPVVNVTVQHGAVEVTSCRGEQVSLDRAGLSTVISMMPDGTCSTPSTPSAQQAKFLTLTSEADLADR